MRKTIQYTVFIGLIGLVSWLLYPKTYDIPPFKNRKTTQYWHLSTGSRIGYTHILAKARQQPSPIIFLQGGPGAPIFDSNIEILSKFADIGYDVYLYDLLGCGHSNRLENISEYTVERHKQDLAEIIDSIGAKKVIFIAQSWGALLAVNYLTDNAAKIERIIFTGAGPILPIRNDLKEMVAPDSLHLKKPMRTNAQGKQKAYNSRVRLIEWFAQKLDYKLAADKEMDNFATYLNFEMNKSTLVDTTLVKPKGGYGYYVNVKTAQNFEQVADRRAVLKQCKTPILLMRGQFDGIPWGYAQEYLTLFKNHQLVVIPKAGHVIAAEQPELYVQTIKAFLEKKI